MVQRPSVHRIETCAVHPVCLGFGKQVQRPAGFLAKGGDGGGPELGRDLIGYVAAESVDAAAYPELHCLCHSLMHLRGAVVELGDIGPVVFDHRAAERVAVVPLCGLLRDPRVVGSGVVGHPVEHDLHPKRVGLLHEGVEVFERAELRIDRAVVLDGVVGAEGALAAEFADRIDRHQPDNVHSQLAQAGEVSRGGAEGALRGELAGVELIDNALGDEGVVCRRGCRLIASGNKRHNQAGNCQDVFSHWLQYFSIV